MVNGRPSGADDGSLLTPFADAAPARVSRGLLVIATLPLLVVFVASLYTVAGWAAGAAPFWPQETLTLSEAVGIASAGEVVKLITIDGHDPNRAWPVREGIFGRARTLTPLESAVLTRRVEMVDLLLRHGALIPSGVTRDLLICRAAAVGATDVVAYLLERSPGPDPRPACPPQE